MEAVGWHAHVFVGMFVSQGLTNMPTSLSRDVMFYPRRDAKFYPLPLDFCRWVRLQPTSSARIRSRLSSSAGSLFNSCP